jgi:hypothetical protein
LAMGGGLIGLAFGMAGPGLLVARLAHPAVYSRHFSTDWSAFWVGPGAYRSACRSGSDP